jgi:hypothetical protein
MEQRTAVRHTANPEYYTGEVLVVAILLITEEVTTHIALYRRYVRV